MKFTILHSATKFKVVGEAGSDADRVINSEFYAGAVVEADDWIKALEKYRSNKQGAHWDSTLLPFFDYRGVELIEVPAISAVKVL